MATKETRRQVVAAAQACDDKKGEETRILELDPADSGLADFFLITSASNDRQVVAIADEIELRLKKEFGLYPASVEGRRQAEWILLDYVDIVVHVFLAEKRAYYDIERLRKSARNLTAPEIEAELEAEPEAQLREALAAKTRAVRSRAPAAKTPRRKTGAAAAKSPASKAGKPSKAGELESATATATHKGDPRVSAKPVEKAAKKAVVKKAAKSATKSATGPAAKSAAQPAKPAAKAMGMIAPTQFAGTDTGAKPPILRSELTAEPARMGAMATGSGVKPPILRAEAPVDAVASAPVSLAASAAVAPAKPAKKAPAKTAVKTAAKTAAKKAPAKAAAKKSKK